MLMFTVHSKFHTFLIINSKKRRKDIKYGLMLYCYVILLCYLDVMLLCCYFCIILSLFFRLVLANSARHQLDTWTLAPQKTRGMA